MAAEPRDNVAPPAEVRAEITENGEDGKGDWQEDEHSHAAKTTEKHSEHES